MARASLWAWAHAPPAVRESPRQLRGTHARYSDTATPHAVQRLTACLFIGPKRTRNETTEAMSSRDLKWQSLFSAVGGSGACISFLTRTKAGEMSYRPPIRQGGPSHLLAGRGERECVAFNESKSTESHSATDGLGSSVPPITRLYGRPASSEDEVRYVVK